jgi:UDP-GlcNAc:undecaprenyl-phosphate/decaprenyl-phosphate GlcNAc-1-phosphate transferase
VILALAQSELLPLADPLLSPVTPDPQTRLSIFEGYIGVLVAAFLVTLLATPLMRRLAVAGGVIDMPSDPRKVHRLPVAYLGGIAVYLGLLAGILYSYISLKVPDLIQFHDIKPAHLKEADPAAVPLSILLGITVIMFVGMLDDVRSISPRVKIGGQLFAAAALAVDNVGVKLASGIMLAPARSLGIPITELSDGTSTILFTIPLPVHIAGITEIRLDVVYWAGTAVIAIAVLGLCNASNLLDGLDGLLTGTTAIASCGLLVLALSMALVDDGPRDAQRIVLCLALLGACLGFLPHNFNPATIFLGDAGSLMLGFCTCVIILTLGDTGRTHLVAAGLIIYAVPIIDTSLAIVRRKMEGKSISTADDQHLHHMLRRALGVRGAVGVLYSIAILFAALGAGISLVRARVVYVLAMVLAAYIGVTAIKIARRRAIEAQALSHQTNTPPIPAPDTGAPQEAMPREPMPTLVAPLSASAPAPVSKA